MKRFIIICVCLLGLIGCKKNELAYSTEIMLQFTDENQKPIKGIELVFSSFRTVPNGFLSRDIIISKDTVLSDSFGEVLFVKETPATGGVLFEISGFPSGFTKSSLPNEFWKSSPVNSGIKKSWQFILKN